MVKSDDGVRPSSGPRQVFDLAVAFLALPGAFFAVPLTGFATGLPFDAASSRADSRDLIRAALLR